MKKILLVEDNEAIQKGLKYSLEQENFEIETAENIVTAKTKIIFTMLRIVLFLVSVNQNLYNEIPIKKEILKLVFLK